MTNVRLTRRGFLVTTILHSTFLTWYYVFSFMVLGHIFGSSTETYLIVYASFNFIIVTTLFLSSFFIHKFNKVRVIFGCSVAISMLALFLPFVSNIILRLIVIFVEGIFFSIGQLASFTYFWSLTVSEERGRAAGLAGFFSLLFLHLISLMAQTLDFFGTVMLSAILILGTLTTRLLRLEKKVLLTTKRDEKGCRPEKRTIFLYSVPGILFSLINTTLARNISFHISQSVPSSLYMFLLVLQMVASGFGALGGGMIADIFGRRLSLAFSLTLYGISTALGGFVENYEVLYFMYVVNGLNWGILWTLYGFVVWGDLADKESCAKRYSLGLAIFYLSTGVGFSLTPQIYQIPLSISSLTSCLLIFLSNVPLILAPELLSSDFREKIKLRLHMNIVGKIQQKLSQNQG